MLSESNIHGEPQREKSRPGLVVFDLGRLYGCATVRSGVRVQSIPPCQFMSGYSLVGGGGGVISVLLHRHSESYGKYKL